MNSLRIRPFRSEHLPALRPADARAVENAFALGSASGFPVDLEIGCGAGMHALEYCSGNPSRILIAAEHTKTKFDAFQEHRRKRGVELPNLFAVHCNAISLLAGLPQRPALERVFLFYPNPEVKAKNRRWFRAPAMAKILDALKPGGALTLVTNLEWYFEEALDLAVNAWGLGVVSKRSFNQGTSPRPAPRTHFEKKYLERGETCFEATFNVISPASSTEGRTGAESAR